MALEMGLWRADGGKLTKLVATGIGLESQLEDYIESDPSLMGARLLLVGRQVATDYGGFIDLLAVDSEGLVHVIELKRDKTPRDVVAQTLDYGSWVADLSRADIVAIFAKYKPGVAFEEAYAEEFGQAPPEELNTAQALTIVASSVDPATERIVRFLNEGFAVPVNVVFFRHFEDRGASYLARTWLVEHETQTATSATAKAQKSKEPWNGQDWYVSFGEEPGGRVWDDAVKYGFVSAGGGEWFSRTLKNLPIGARVFANIPKSGYVGVGTVVGGATRFDKAEIEIDGVPTSLSTVPLSGNYRNPGDADSDALAEFVVPVEWQAVKPRSEGVWKTGMFANQNSACHLRSQFTIDQLSLAFELDD
ncbi:endonuclease NucS domain-containing protein [Williamsia sterculiae]|uniref:DUF91 domain-containing protein n=1 Tax=Williamsia sterculiae TaxID=1344003 RepID=A0A1N7GI09_9NOCA|nr:endonuclease NucS domain-containing protein [Williamsia sterculiae]SIS12217.1 Protein of unknown function DUF91 [Williamsia sterculiae]